MRPKHVAKYERRDGTKWYLITLQNDTTRFYRSARALPPTVKQWLEWHTASGDVGVVGDGLVYHYWG